VKSGFIMASPANGLHGYTIERGSPTFPPPFRATTGTSKRGACEHRLAVHVRTTHSKNGKSI
jgi:hypothetical protein